MKAALADLDDLALERLGVEVVRLISSGDFHALHARFGYALSLGREPVSALAQDVKSALAEVGATGFRDPVQSSVAARHFEPNDIGLSGLVECLVSTNNGKLVLVELVLTSIGSEGHIMLEQVSAAT